MKPTSVWIIRLALTVQFLGVLSVPAILSANDLSSVAPGATEVSPHASWTAEWLRLRQRSITRTVGVLKLGDGKLTFVEQIGHANWELDLASIRKVGTVNGGRTLLIVSITGDEYIVSIKEANLSPGSPKGARSTIEKALQLHTANSR
jgi:hypothetical protein